MRATANALMQSMQREIERSMSRLRAPRHPRPYYISYLVRDIESFNAWARYGALHHAKAERRRLCYADVRVGSYRYDHTSRGGLTDAQDELESTELVDLPIEDDVDSLRFCLWRLTDAKFREAVSRYHGKRSRDVSFLDQNRALASFQKLDPERDTKTLKRLNIDEKYYSDLVRRLSLIFKPYPEIKNSYVEFSAEMTHKYFVSSEGVLRAWQEPVYSLSIYFWYHTKTLDQDCTIVHHVRDLDEIPSMLDLQAEILHKMQQFQAMEQGEEMTSFAGPVLLAPKAAGLFLHEVLGHRLEGSRLLSESEGRTFKDKLDHKIMHPDLSLYDDPTLKTFNGSSLLAHYPYDDEGVPAARAVLVERGVLKGFLSTRSPLAKGAHRSNGHARNQGEERPISRMANLLVKSHSRKTWADLKRRLLEEVRRQKLAFGIMLLEVEGGETETDAYNFQAFMGQITLAKKIYADGREEFVKGVDFVGTPLSSLSHIIAVGGEYAVDNGYCGAESGTIPVSTISPALLLSTLELQAKNPSKVTQYAMPLPWFEKDERRRPAASATKRPKPRRKKASARKSRG